VRVIVCGGRSYNEPETVYEALDGLHREYCISAIIEGGAPGADEWARIWARVHGVKLVTVPANWAELGKAAGPIRNQRMIDAFAPDIVVSFPGGKGTADMIRRAEQAGITVKKYGE
jgi:predicted Rossmann-fold nucleotide-binding protein